jgi:hypothetical protein|tara:strand:- start:1716 stop:1991 length:276 start_codon:yes stop_codon:yes gene_type:complete
MKLNDIVTVVAVTGAEYIGKFRKETDATFVIGDPHIVSPIDDNIQFMPTVAMTGAPNIGEATFQKTGVLLVVRTAEEVAKGYTKSISGIIL